MFFKQHVTDATDRFSLFELIGLDLDQASASMMFFGEEMV